MQCTDMKYSWVKRMILYSIIIQYNIHRSKVLHTLEVGAGMQQPLRLYKISADIWHELSWPPRFPWLCSSHPFYPFPVLVIDHLLTRFCSRRDFTFDQIEIKFRRKIWKLTNSPQARDQLDNLVLLAQFMHLFYKSVEAGKQPLQTFTL